MKRRIMTWAVVGFAVAGFWAIFAIATFPSNERMREAWPLVTFSCPIAMLGERYPVALYQALIANALTYAIAGLIVEVLRKHLLSSQRSKHHGLGPLRQG